MKAALNLLILGTTGTGKSHKAALIARHSKEKVIILHATRDQTYETLLPNMARVNLLSPYRRGPLSLSKIRQRIISFYCTGFSSQEIKDFLIDFSKLIQAEAPAIVIIDEAHEFLRKHLCPKEMITTIRAARHFNLIFLVVTHALQDIDSDIRRVVTDVACFRLIGDTTTDLVKRTFIDRQSEIEVLQTLPSRRYRMIHPATASMGPEKW